VLVAERPSTQPDATRNNSSKLLVLASLRVRRWGVGRAKGRQRLLPHLQNRCSPRPLGTLATQRQDLPCLRRGTRRSVALAHCREGQWSVLERIVLICLDVAVCRFCCAETILSLARIDGADHVSSLILVGTARAGCAGPPTRPCLEIIRRRHSYLNCRPTPHPISMVGHTKERETAYFLPFLGQFLPRTFL
jgi:hypothetical protein